MARYKASEIIDAKGQAAYPGLIDAHAHFVGMHGLFFRPICLVPKHGRKPLSA